MSSATRSIRRHADQAVNQALEAGLDNAFKVFVQQHPRSRSRAGTFKRHYLRAVRGWLECHPTV